MIAAAYCFVGFALMAWLVPSAPRTCAQWRAGGKPAFAAWIAVTLLILGWPVVVALVARRMWRQA